MGLLACHYRADCVMGLPCPEARTQLNAPRGPFPLALARRLWTISSRRGRNCAPLSASARRSSKRLGGI
jgi:hypothetical protein